MEATCFQTMNDHVEQRGAGVLATLTVPQTRERQEQRVRKWELQELQGVTRVLILKERRVEVSESQTKEVEG